MKLNIQNVYRSLTHISAVARGSLLQRCQWLSSLTQTKLTKVQFKTLELVLQRLLRFQHCHQIQWIEVG